MSEDKKNNEKKAIALKYNYNKDRAPKIIAKGKGEIAKKIIEIAKEKKIPLYEDKGMAQVLEALDLNTEIPQSLYKAIAEVLVFIYKLDKQS